MAVSTECAAALLSLRYPSFKYNLSHVIATAVSFLYEMVQPLREQSLLVVSERQKGSAQGRILGGPRGPWPTLFLWKF